MSKGYMRRSSQRGQVFIVRNLTVEAWIKLGNEKRRTKQLEDN